MTLEQSPRSPEQGGPYVAVFCASPEDERSVAGVFGPNQCVRVYHSWQDIANVTRADCGVFVARRVDEASVRLAICAIRRRASTMPVILATARDIHSAELAIDLAIDAVVWCSEISSTLRKAVDRACNRSFLVVVGYNAQLADHLPAVMRDVIAAYCRRSHPHRSLKGVASDIGVSRTTIWRAWTRGAPRGLTVKTFEGWLLLLRAVAERQLRTTWANVAAELDVDEDTLARAAKRVMRVPIRDLGRGSLNAVRERFCSEILAPLGIRTPRNRIE